MDRTGRWHRPVDIEKEVDSLLLHLKSDNSQGAILS